MRRYGCCPTGVIGAGRSWIAAKFGCSKSSRPDGFRPKTSPSGVGRTLHRGAAWSGSVGRSGGCAAIQGGGLVGLRSAARESECSLAELLLAVLGLVLDEQAFPGSASIAILDGEGFSAVHAVQARPHTLRQTRWPTEMPWDMRLALAERPGQRRSHGSDGPGVAFRYIQRSCEVVAEGDACLLGLAWSHGACPFNLVTEAIDCENRLYLISISCSPCVDLHGVQRFHQEYVRALKAVAREYRGA